MPHLKIHGISLYYETHGSSGTPVLLLTGLNGVGQGWGPQIGLFSRDHRVIVPDHRGTGASTLSSDGYTIEEHAADMAELVRRLAVGPVHVVGSSTGGAIAQVMALDHRDVVRTATIASSWARCDEFFRRQFETRKNILIDSGPRKSIEASVQFLFSPRFIRENPERIEAWVHSVSGAPSDQDITIKRIDMVLAHDQFERLREIRCPVLVITGRQDFCTPPYFAEELAREIPGAELHFIEGGHFVHLEDPAGYHECINAFIARSDAHSPGSPTQPQR